MKKTIGALLAIACGTTAAYTGSVLAVTAVVSRLVGKDLDKPSKSQLNAMALFGGMLACAGYHSYMRGINGGVEDDVMESVTRKFMPSEHATEETMSYDALQKDGDDEEDDD